MPKGVEGRFEVLLCLRVRAEDLEEELANGG